MTRSLIAACCLFLFVTAAWIVRAAEPAVIGTNMGVQIDLKTELQKGLKARRPCEFQYIDQLIALMEAGEVPQSMVDSTFIWARKQPTRQLQYFQFALRARADKLGIVTPNLEDQFVSPFTGTMPNSSIASRTTQLKDPKAPAGSILNIPLAPVSQATDAATGNAFSQAFAATFLRARAARAVAAAQPGLTSSERGVVARTLDRIFTNRLTSIFSNP
jgi:hypothetical protein